MIQKTTAGYYVFPTLQKIDFIHHAISTISFGDMNFAKKENSQNIKKYADAAGFDTNKMTFMDQVHSRTVKEARIERGKVYKKVDGLITNKKIVINAKSADCVPVLLIDKESKTIAVIHSGWKGTYKNIIANLLEKMKEKNISISDLIVGIGPSIRDCCYNIEEERYIKFKTAYSTWDNLFLTKKDEKYFINLPELIKLQLLKEGVLRENIEDADICTKDSADFFSYRRKEDKKNVKVFLTSIALI